MERKNASSPSFENCCKSEEGQIREKRSVCNSFLLADITFFFLKKRATVHLESHSPTLKNDSTSGKILEFCVIE